MADGRQILNANKGITNVIPPKVINTDLRRVTDNLFQILKHHYGPYSGFAAIDDNQPLNETVFTKDGIGIVSAIEFASPQEEWVRKTIAYIGSRMESSVGDGTTSAMMFSCAMLKHMSEHIDELKPISYNKLRNVWQHLLEEIKSYIDRYYTLKPTDENDEVDDNLVREIVYNQVYTSSHGDTALASAIAEIYANTPRELWERMTYERSTHETDKDYEIIKSEGQYHMNAEPMATSMLNKDLCTWFYKKNCTLIVVNDALRVSSPDWPIIMDRIDKGTVERPVVIICHRIMDTDSYQRLNEKIVECDKEGRPFAVFTQKPSHPRVNDFVALQLIAGIDILKYANGEAFIKDGTDIKWKSKVLSIDNFVEVPEGYNKKERFQMTDGKHAQYTDAVETWKTIAENYAKQARTPEDKNIATQFSRMYVKLRYNNVYTIRVGGKAYDNVAFVTVLDDAIRAASHALTYGATFGNNKALYLTICRMLANHRVHTPTSVWFAKRILESLDDIGEVIVEGLYPKQHLFFWEKQDFVEWWYTHSVDLLQYDPNYGSRPLLGLFGLKAWRNQYANYFTDIRGDKAIEFCLLRDSNNAIIQPANADIAMLERFGEIALKFILTDRIIIAGGAYVSKKR